MRCVRKVTDDLYWIGGNDKRLQLFENIHPIPDGVSYNSYVLLDEKTALFDTADWSVGQQFIENLESVLDGRPLDFIVVNHFEPDHAASLAEVMLRYPEAKVITTKKGDMFGHQYGYDFEDRLIEVDEGDTWTFGKHKVAFVKAPMVHWPEVMMTFDLTNGVLFSADAFGSFKSLDGALFADEVDFEHDWLDEARRYYTNIVGKYGPQVVNVLKKAGTLDIKYICPLHGPVWRKNIGWFIDKYMHWATYTPEEKGVLIVFGSMYGHTENAAFILASKLHEKGVHNIKMYDVSKTHTSYLISEAFRYSHIVLLSVTYNLNLFPPMQDFVEDMKRLNMQKRVVGIVENGTWSPQSGRIMNEFMDEMKQMTVLNEQVTVLSSVNDSTEKELDGLAASVADSMDLEY
jgi:flavorubredoxin